MLKESKGQAKVFVNALPDPVARSVRSCYPVGSGFPYKVGDYLATIPNALMDLGDDAAVADQYFEEVLRIPRGEEIVIEECYAAQSD